MYKLWLTSDQTALTLCNIHDSPWYELLAMYLQRNHLTLNKSHRIKQATDNVDLMTLQRVYNVCNARHALRFSN